MFPAMAGLSIWTVSVLAGLLVGWFLLLGHRRRRKEEPPLETGWIPYFGCALEFAANPFKFMETRQNKYGEAFTCKIAGKFTTFITDPFSYSVVIRHGKSLDFQKIALTISRNVFDHVDFANSKYNITNDEIHHIFTRTLQGSMLGSLASNMMENLQFVMFQGKSSLDSHKWTVENLYEFSCRLMFEAGHLTLFGKNEKAMKGGDVEKIKQQHSAIQFALKEFKAFDTVFPALVAGIPLGFFKTAKKARKSLEERFLHKTLRQQDCKSALIEERMNIFDRSSVLNEHNKAKTHVVMLWASQANTLPATFWSIYYLMRTPEALKAVKNEVENILKATNQKPDINNPIIFKREQLDNMPTMGSLINEALRLSSASMMIRIATEDILLTLDSGIKVAIRKGDHLALYPQLLHLDPEIYEDPQEFKYNRFLDENGKEKTTFYKNGRKLKYYLMPFGSGISMCPGRHFAINEIKQFLSLMLCYYDMELLDATALPPALDNTRAGLGILQPCNDVLFHYRLKQ